MNRSFKTEQLSPDLSLVVDFDQTLSPKEIKSIVRDILGKDKTKIIPEGIQYRTNNKVITLLIKSISYLGNPHPIYKKRMQVSGSQGSIFKELSNKSDSDAKFIGVYHYDGLLVFVDFVPFNTDKKFNNSSLHVYLNDIFQGVKNRHFKKLDKNKNEINVIHSSFFKEYIDGDTESNDNEIFKIFKEFNNELKFNEWISAMEAIPFMFFNNGQWKQAEWNGFYLENKFECFLNENDLKNIITFTANKNKNEDWNKGIFDFDLFFLKQKFYGDLKASDLKSKDAPANDCERTLNYLNKFEKLWYIIYEHETISDKKRQNGNSKATRFRNDFIKDKEPKSFKNELSYESRMKHSIKFNNMKIYEINRINYNKVLKKFNQGKQPNGAPRNSKFSIIKETSNKNDNIESLFNETLQSDIKKDNDNVVIYRFFP